MGGVCRGWPLLPGPILCEDEVEILGGGADGSGFLRSSLNGSSFFVGFPLSLLGPLSRGGALSLRAWPGVGERELAEDTGLARSAYMSSESALRLELVLEEAEDTEETLLTLRDLDFLDFLEPEREMEAEEERVREPEGERERELEPL